MLRKMVRLKDATDAAVLALAKGTGTDDDENLLL